MLLCQCRRQREGQSVSAIQLKFRCRFRFFIFCKSLWPYYNILLAPNDQVRTTLCHTSFLCLAHKIIESVQGTLQPLVCEHAIQARYRQCKQQHQYEDSKDYLDQSKRSETSHRQNYSLYDKSQHGRRDVFLL